MKLLRKWRYWRLERLARLTKTELRATPGVDLKVAVNGQWIVDADSDFLYWLAIWGGFRTDGDNWAELEEISPAPLPNGGPYKLPLRPGTVQVFIRPRPRSSDES